MSSLYLIGFFALAQGHRQMTTKANNTRTWHAHYTTSLQCFDGTSLPADVRVYSPMNDILHADNTVAFIYARAHIPKDAPVQMDASHLIPCPGDPENDDYEDNVPDLPNPFLLALGQVTARASYSSNGSRAFPVAASEYVRENTQLSNISCVFSGTRPRWKNTNVPYPGTIVQVIGTCSHLTQDGLLAVDIENIVLTVPTSSAAGAMAETRDHGGSDVSPSKKRKFCAFAASKASKPSTEKRTMFVQGSSDTRHDKSDQTDMNYSGMLPTARQIPISMVSQPLPGSTSLDDSSQAASSHTMDDENPPITEDERHVVPEPSDKDISSDGEPTSAKKRGKKATRKN